MCPASGGAGAIVAAPSSGPSDRASRATEHTFRLMPRLGGHVRLQVGASARTPLKSNWLPASPCQARPNPCQHTGILTVVWHVAPVTTGDQARNWPGLHRLPDTALWRYGCV